MTGILLPYRNCEIFHSCLPVIYNCISYGIDLEIFSTDSTKPLHPFTDQFVTDKKNTGFDEWVDTRGLEYLICTNPLSQTKLEKVKKSKTKIALICYWHNLTEANTEHLSDYDLVVCPARCVADTLFDHFKLENIRWVPWDTDIEFTNQSVPCDDHVCISWWLCNGTGLKSEFDLIDHLSPLFDQTKATLDIHFLNSLPACQIERIDKLISAFPNRVLLNNVTDFNLDRAFSIGMDLAICPAIATNVSMASLYAIYNNVPVVAFDTPVIADVIKDEVNGFLVECDLVYSWCGVPYVVPDYKKFVSKIIDLCRHPNQLQHVKKENEKMLRKRRSLFNSGWHNFLINTLFS